MYDFNYSIEKHTAVYHHFLDGLISKEVGNNTINVINTLRELNIINSLNYKNIIFLNTEINDAKNYILNFSEMTNLCKIYDFEMDFRIEQNYDDNFLNIFKNNFCIFPTNFNYHTSSSIIFTKENKLYFYILNSGAGINYNGSSKLINDKILYQLTKGIVLSNNINDKNNLIDGINKLKKILFMSFFYNYIENSKYKKDEFDIDQTFWEFLCYLKFINYSILFEYNKSEIINSDSFNKNINVTNKSNVLNMHDTYYKIISEFMDTLCAPVNIMELNICDIDLYSPKNNKNLIGYLNSKIDAREYFFEKIILYFKDDNLYIIDQQSSSCSWFAIYYSIILYFVIFKDYNLYKMEINKINVLFDDYITNVFNKDNLKREFIKIENNNFTYMKKLCSKFVDMNIINKDKLFETEQFLYSELIYFNKSIKNNKINFLAKKKLIIKDLKKINIEEYISNNISIEAIGDINEFLLNAYNLCLEEKKGNNFFNKNFNIDFILLKERINEFNSDIRSQMILYHLSMFKNTYKFNFCENCPSYLFYFIPIIQYINYIDVEHYSGKIILDIEENNKDLFSCCILYLRLVIISNILRFIMKISGTRENWINLIKIIIIPLLENTNSEILDYKLHIIISLKFLEDSYFMINKKKEDDNGYSFIESFNCSIDDYLNYENNIYDNLNELKSDFLIYNIRRINKREDVKEKLIKYFSKKYFIQKKNNEMELEDTISKLIIVLYGYPTQSEIYKNNTILVYFTSSVVGKILNKLEILFNEYNDVNNFIDYINQNREKIYKINIFELIPDYEYIEGNHYICGEKYDIYDNSYFLSCFFENNINILVSEITVQNSFNIYQIYYDNIIIYKCVCKNLIPNSNWCIIRINEILFNNNKVIRFENVIYPFKYLIPNTCFNFIYEKNDVYNITYLIKDNETKNIPNLLGKQATKTGVNTFQINPDTQFFLKKGNLIIYKFNNLCTDFQVNNFNILYINFFDLNLENTGYSCSEKICKFLYNFNKNVLKDKISYELEDFSLLKKNIDIDTEPFIKIDIDETENMNRSLKKLLFKISSCKIKEENKIYWKNKLEKYKNRLNREFINFTNYIKNLYLDELLTKVTELQKYLLQVKIYNLINKLLKNFDNEKYICSLIKNYKFLFDLKKEPLNYKFELLFELINGNQILDEQIKRYKLMIKSHDDYHPKLDGGSYLLSVEGNYNDINEEIIEKNCKNNYPLHHFMMGKGKSAIITPLLALYFNIIYKKEVYIIVPKHLVKQTNDTIYDYLCIFEIDNIYISSEDQIKNDYLHKKINVDNSIFLIDEFDTLISPLKSEYNLIMEKNINIKNIGLIIKNIIINLEEKLNKKIDISVCDIESYLIDDIIIKNKDIFIKNLISIINQINNETLKLNISWGIDKQKLYAIPYRNKDKPIENSSFSSVILTVFLTYYYYIIINKRKIDNNIFKFIIDNNYHKLLLSIFIDEFNLTKEIINSRLSEDIKYEKLLFEKIDQQIFNNLLLPSHQINTSFVDIINIDKIFKIGYSGTVDMNLPILYSEYIFSKNCLYDDEDESYNIEYAIKTSKINNEDIKNILNECFLDSYDALIDICGYFYNISNINIALKINNLLNRDVIFIDENDNKMIIINNNLQKYDENIYYENLFFYYDQAHTIGIDIKQDNYPILEGLCIVDKYTTYTEVAQGMYRLRKLNMGHKISFIFYNFNNKDITTTELLKKFKDNQKELIEKQQKNLNIQALKSDFRKKLNIGNDRLSIIKKHEEKLYHYFLEENIEGNLLSYIFYELESISNNYKDINLCAYEIDINDIKNIIFKTNLNNIESQIENEKEIEKKSEQNISNILIDKKELILFNFTNFKDYNFIKKITSINFDDYTFKIDNDISFLPNIFKDNNDSLSSLYIFRQTINSKDLMFIYFDFGKFLLVPRYLTTYLYNEFVLLDLNLIKINSNKQINNIKDIEKLKNNIFIKIINNNFTDDELDCFLFDEKNTIYIKILLFLLFFQKKDININDKFFEFYNHHKEIIFSETEAYFLRPKNQKIICNLTPYFREFIDISMYGGSNLFYKKYLKYKNKYIKIKNK